MPVVGMTGQYCPGARLGWALGSALAPGCCVVQSSAERSTSVMLPLIWVNLISSACCGVAARMTICCWPFRVVFPPLLGWPLGAGACVACGLLAVGGGRSVPSTWSPGARSFTVAWLYSGSSTFTYVNDVPGAVLA